MVSVPALMLAACGGSDPEAGSTSIGDTPPPPVVSTANTEPTDPVASTAPSSTEAADVTDVPDATPIVPTLEELTAILPTAEEIGPGFVAVEPSLEPAAGSGILNEESLSICPALAQLLLQSDANTAEVAQAQFVDPASTRTFQVQLGVEPEQGDPDTVQSSYDELIAAIESCPVINAEIPGVGVYSTFPSVARVDGLGEASMHLALNGFLANEALVTEVNYSIYFWERDGVSAGVIAVSGLDDQGQAVLVDEAEVERVVTALDGRIAALVG